MKRFEVRTVALLMLPVLALSALAFWPKNQSSELRLSIEKKEFTKFGTFKLSGRNKPKFLSFFREDEDELRTCEPHSSQCIDKKSTRTFYPMKDSSITFINRGEFGFSREDVYDASILKKLKGPLIFKMRVSCSTRRGKRTQSQWVTLEVDPKTIKPN